MLNNKCHLITFPKITDYRGNLTFIENNKHIPFTIKRVFYLYDISENVIRANHAHKKLQEVLISLSGSFHVTINNGQNNAQYQLNSPFIGLYIPSLTWVKIDNFSSNTVCLVLASALYDESDYIHNYEDFITLINKKNEH
ncbi:FdtA/QdtA family cupin domain-containing protein [Geminocystis sp. GBBB08]|uniref:sugar 3,4-ketoisomerase n=1 Tax=Geminocystis sp. GBBB08 TaxID=2604140 RepID=UPI0027E30632|nr:FdtA/QdtA family cupin domain-containing protein [Geminocystis sp. GBBB08]MBL1209361.1 WxcM-like domain-containing protein [Geminocystis sp. GBBB08]